MATTKYGAWTTYGSENVFRVVMEYEITTNADTTATIKVTSKIQYGPVLQQWPPSVSRSFTLVTSVGGSEATTTHNITYTWAKRNTTETLNTRSVTVSKTHAAQSVAMSAYLWTTVQSNPDPSFKYGSLASGTQSVSAKTSYKVTFDANGGDTNSLPATQTKWHGETLTLSSTVPVKSGCTFLGWATTNAGGGTHYQPGASYTGNAALKLYAVWVGVSIETIGAIRCDQDGTEADEGTYGHVDATWRATGTIAGTVAVTARYKATSWSSVTLSGDTSKSKAARSDASGSVASTFGGSLDTDKTYQVQVTATMTYTYDGVSGSVTASMSAYVPYAYITMDFYRGGHGVAFGGPAVADGLHSYMPATFHDTLTAPNIGAITSDSATASVSSGSGTALCSLTLDAGTYIIEGNAGFASNATGRRIVNLATTSGSVTAATNNQTGVEVPAVSGGMTALHTTWQTKRTAQTTIYLNAYQTSGAALSVTGYIRAMRIQ